MISNALQQRLYTWYRDYEIDELKKLYEFYSETLNTHVLEIIIDVLQEKIKNIVVTIPIKILNKIRICNSYIF